MHNWTVKTRKKLKLIKYEFDHCKLECTCYTNNDQTEKKSNDMAKLKLINYECDHCNTKSNILPDLYLYLLYLWTHPCLCIHIKSKAKTGERGGRVVLIFLRYFDSLPSVITLMLLWKNSVRLQNILFWCFTTYTNLTQITASTFVLLKLNQSLLNRYIVQTKSVFYWIGPKAD